MDKIESYVIDGQLWVTTKFIEAYYNTDDRNIRNWITKGLPCEKMQGIKQNCFNLKETIMWHIENINQTKSKASRRSQEKTIDEMMDERNLEDIDSVSQEEADRRKKILDVKLAQVKLDEAEGRLIPADDLDKSLYEQAVMHITKLNNDEQILPILLENKNQEEIRDILHEHNEEHLATLDEQIERKFKTDPSNYDIFNKVLEARKKGTKPKELISIIENTTKGK